MKLNNRNKLLLGSFLLMLVMSYQLTFKKTSVLKEEYHANLEKQEQAVHVPKELSMLSQKDRYLDAQFKELDLGDSSLQNDLLKFLNEYCSANNVKIIEFKSPHIFQGPSSQSKTYRFKLEGDFNRMLKTIHEIESKGSFGMVSHIAFEKKKDFRRRKDFLQALVFLEHVE